MEVTADLFEKRSSYLGFIGMLLGAKWGASNLEGGMFIGIIGNQGATLNLGVMFLNATTGVRGTPTLVALSDQTDILTAEELRIAWTFNQTTKGLSVEIYRKRTGSWVQVASTTMDVTSIFTSFDPDAQACLVLTNSVQLGIRTTTIYTSIRVNSRSL
jgi:hypothetical protein